MANTYEYFYNTHTTSTSVLRHTHISPTLLSTLYTTQHSMVNFGCVRAVSLKFNCNMRDIEHARVVPSGASHHAEQTLRSLLLRSMSYKHLQHQVTGLASVFLNLQSSHAYGRVVSDPIEGAPYNERPLLVLRNAAGA